MDESPELLWGGPLNDQLPQPVPGRYWTLHSSERPWRGRAAIAFLLLGMEAAMAWRFAMSADPQWAAHLRNELLPTFTDNDLAVGVLRQRLAASDAQEAA